MTTPQPDTIDLSSASHMGDLARGGTTWSVYLETRQDGPITAGRREAERVPLALAERSTGRVLRLSAQRSQLAAELLDVCEVLEAELCKFRSARGVRKTRRGEFTGR